ncbi:ebs-bah-phd domain-containing protein [Purpureocillium lilacinum]|uniref:Ebs-bah-phd domain-containing protein n=1 Tax=Purpureocillium lilacinum TaxID=33203 RepID=A0A179FJG6_PURLI|nr:ebs-bah-phd domain-containing protein [Purpureocillium lilacinum]
MPAKGHSPSSNVDTYAPCPFTVSDILPLIHSQVTGKKRKRNVTQGEKGLVQTRPQEWPFGPSGDSRTQRMDVSYRIEPLKGWLDMTRYKSFFLNNVKYYSDDFVYVANDTTVERQKRANEDPDQSDRAGLKGLWVARVLEIRALDEHHVYARVYWMYCADDLPPKSAADQRPVPEQVAGYSQNELIASNHMDIINVVSVVGRATVNHVCANAAEDEGGLHWQWAFDYRTSKLSWLGEINPSSVLLSPSGESTMEEGRSARSTQPLLSITPFKDDVKEAQVPSKPEAASANRIKAAKPPCILTDVAGPSPTNNPCPSNHAESREKEFVESPASQRESIGLMGPAVGHVARGPRPVSKHEDSSQSTLSASTRRTSTRVLTRLQHILERSCYAFAVKALDRQVLRKHQWDDAESLELNRFITELRAIKDLLPARINPTKPLDILLRSVANIRHNAVHRRKVSMEGVEQCLLDATEFAALLGDFQCVEKISTLRREFLHECGKTWTIAGNERKLHY